MSKYFVEVHPFYVSTKKDKSTLETIQQRLDHIVFDSPFGIDYVNGILNDIVAQANSIGTTYTGTSSDTQFDPFRQRSSERNETYETLVFRAGKCQIATIRILLVTSEIQYVQEEGGEE